MCLNWMDCRSLIHLFVASAMQGVSPDVLALDALSFADPSSGGVYYVVCKYRCVRIGCVVARADSSFGGIHNLVCKSGHVTIGCIVTH